MQSNLEIFTLFFFLFLKQEPKHTKSILNSEKYH